MHTVQTIGIASGMADILCKRISTLCASNTRNSKPTPANTEGCVGENGEEKRRALRALMNIRMPGAMAVETLRVQDESLRGCAQEKGIGTPDDILFFLNYSMNRRMI